MAATATSIGPCDMVREYIFSLWYGLANRSCNDVNKMAAPIRTSRQNYFCANSLKEYEIITLI